MKIKVTKVFDRKSGQSNSGEWSFQNFYAKDGNGNDVAGSFCHLPEASDTQGKVIDATKTKDAEYKGKPKLEVYDYVPVQQNKQQESSPMGDAPAPTNAGDLAGRYVALLNFIAKESVEPMCKDATAIQAAAATICIASNGSFPAPGKEIKPEPAQDKAQDQNPVSQEEMNTFDDEDLPF